MSAVMEEKKQRSAERFVYELSEAADAVALSETTVQRGVREGWFPKPRQLSGRRVGWLVRELKEWVENRPVSELLPPPNTSGED